MEYLGKCKNINRIFCGHYHTDKVIAIEDKKIFLTPSTFFQLDNSVNFMKIESIQPGWRLIELDENIFKSEVHYL